MFSDDLDLAFNYHVAFHQAFAYQQVNLSPDYYEFATEMGRSFDEATRAALHEEGFGDEVPRDPGLFQPVEWTRAQMQLGAAAYFEANWRKWRAEKGKEIDESPSPSPEASVNTQ